jgi:hypothetical protein
MINENIYAFHEQVCQQGANRLGGGNEPYQTFAGDGWGDSDEGRSGDGYVSDWLTTAHEHRHHGWW